MAYPTVAEARAAGIAAPEATDAQVQAAVDGAVGTVEWFCRDTFTAATRTVAALLDGGLALLPLRVGTVTEVRVPGAAEPLAASAYRATSSATLGQVDAVRLLSADAGWRAYAGFLVEPVRSAGWGADGTTVEVTGTFGWAETPAAVRTAVLRLARANLAVDGLAAAGGTGGGVNLEGDVDLPPRRISEPVVTPDGTQDVARTSRTTGDTAVDALLRPYVRSRLVVT